MESEENHTKDDNVKDDEDEGEEMITSPRVNHACNDSISSSNHSDSTTSSRLVNGCTDVSSSNGGVKECSTVEMCTPRSPDQLSTAVAAAEPAAVAEPAAAESTELASTAELAATAESAATAGAEAAGEVKQEMVEFKVVYSKQTFNVVFSLDSTVLELKQHVQQLTDVEVKNQKIMYKGLMKDEQTLREQKLVGGAKVMVVGSKTQDIQSVNETLQQVKHDKSSSASSSKEPLSSQKPHKTVLDKYGKPDDVMPGIKNRKDPLPPTPISGMYNKFGSKVRLTFKLEADQVWIGTKERTEKVGLSSIKTIVSEPIEGHEEYHLIGIQLGPTEASRYWIYWVPAQFTDSIKDTVLGNWQYF